MKRTFRVDIITLGGFYLISSRGKVERVTDKRFNWMEGKELTEIKEFLLRHAAKVVEIKQPSNVQNISPIRRKLFK
jgi:hypothetical protein